MSTQTFIFHSDPSHAWLEVPLELMRTLGISDTISSYSYVDEHNAYLEEDCDAPKFMRRMRELNKDFIVEERHIDREHYIRNKSHWRK